MSQLSKTVREAVRQRAGQQCEYCRKPEGVSQFSHHADHIIARKHGGSDDLENLAWACFQCNTNKGSDIASYDNDVLTALFNPRTQIWNDHFEIDELLIVGKTAVGRVTVRTLDMNQAEQIEVRYRLRRAGKW